MLLTALRFSGSFFLIAALLTATAAEKNNNNDILFAGTCERCLLFFRRVYRLNDEGVCETRCVLLEARYRRNGWVCEEDCNVIVEPTDPPSTTNTPTEIAVTTVAPTDPVSTLLPTDASTATLWPTDSYTEQPTENVLDSEFETTLDLLDTDSQYHAAFENASSRWSQVIVGDVPDVLVPQDVKDNANCTRLPDEIDDMFLCPVVVPIDGTGGILGMAGPEYLRWTSNLPFTGIMILDSYDADALASAGIFDDVIVSSISVVFVAYHEP